MINPYVVVHITQPEPQSKSAAALEADAKTAAARAGSLLRSASTRMGKLLPKKHDAGKLLRVALVYNGHDHYSALVPAVSS